MPEPLKRVIGWRRRLDDAIDEIRREPFAWGSQDCVVALAARAVEAMTGVDLAAKQRGTYQTELGALRRMKKLGHNDLSGLIASLLPEIPEGPSGARLGDLVTYEIDDGFKATLGVVNGERAFVLRPEGIGTMDLLKATRAFRVG